MKEIMNGFEYTIERKQKGSRTYFYPVKNGKRFTRTLFARKYDAKNYVKGFVSHYGLEKSEQLSA